VSVVVNAVSVIMVTAGVAFLAVSAVGVVHLPGFFSRAHAVAKSETLGIMLVIGGLIVYNGMAEGSLQLLIVLAIALIANPTAVHALARAALTRATQLSAEEHQ
jgi:multicomponent Na+:H+ antiporter subunit G